MATLLRSVCFYEGIIMSFLTIVSSTMPSEAITTLRRITDVVLLPPDPCLPAPVSSHPDMLLFTLEDTLVTYRSYYTIAKAQLEHILACTGMRLLLTDHPHGNVYPTDVGLNALVCGQTLFGKLDALAPEVLSLAVEKGLTPISVRQGYAGCSGLYTGELLLTADPSLTKAAQARSIPLLPVPDNNIILPGYDHGFIGGCGGVWHDTIYLCGTPTPDQLARYFCSPLLKGKSLVFLYDGPLFDCGGIRMHSFSQ